MSNVKILMALLAACILVMPAISMPDNGNPTIGQDCSQIPPTMGDGAQNPQGCPCQKPMIGPNGDDGKQIPPMMGDGAQNPQGCPCQKPMIGPSGQDGKKILSMMGDGAQNPQGCPCQKPMIGPNGDDGKQKIGPKSMMGNDAKTIVCLTTCKVIGQSGQKIPSIGPNGEDGKQIPSMIGDGAQNPQGCTCQKPMIGPNGEDGKQKVWNDQNSAPGELEQGNQ